MRSPRSSSSLLGLPPTLLLLVLLLVLLLLQDSLGFVVLRPSLGPDVQHRGKKGEGGLYEMPCLPQLGSDPVVSCVDFTRHC